MIIIHFFRQILTLSNNHSISLRDFMTTIVSYFSINSGSADREAETTPVSIHKAFVYDLNLQGIGVSDTSDK